MLFNLNTPNLTDLFGFMLVLFFLKKSKVTFGGFNKKNTYVHILLLFLYLLTTHQIYNFMPTIRYYLSFNLLTQNVNNFLSINQYSIFINTDFKKNIPEFTNGVLKSIFEKNIFIINNNLYELYNYNNQILIQIYGYCILVVLYLIIVYFLFIYSIVKKKVIL
jgi:hypothetical protein